MKIMPDILKKITQQELIAFLGVLSMLKSGLAKHDKNYDDARREVGFNMDICLRERRAGCGTVGCFGGWMAFAMGRKDRFEAEDYIYNDRSEALADMFFPTGIEAEYHTITVKQTIKAAESFLACGDPCWKEALGG